MSLLAALKSAGPNGFGYASTAADVLQAVELTGKRYLVTGCNSGMGLETARALARSGAHVVAAARTLDKARAACAGLPAATPVACELSAPESVRACAAAIAELDVPLDGIVCNAGIMALPKLALSHGFERQFFTNHIGHFLLVTSLLEQLDDRARVVVVSSDAHRAAPAEGIQFDNLDGSKGYRAWTAYAQSKLANLLFARELALRFAGSGRTANALHPGVIKTNLTRNMNPLAGLAVQLAGPLLLKSVAQGAATQVYVAAHPDAAGLNGQYFADCNVARSSAAGRDALLARRLWEVSEQIIAGLE